MLQVLKSPMWAVATIRPCRARRYALLTQPYFSEVSPRALKNSQFTYNQVTLMGQPFTNHPFWGGSAMFYFGGLRGREGSGSSRESRDSMG